MTFFRWLSRFLLFRFHFDFSFRFFISISAYDWSVAVPWMIRLNTGM